MLNFLINMFKVSNNDCKTTSSDFTEVFFLVTLNTFSTAFKIWLLFYSWVWWSIWLMSLKNIGKFLGKHLCRSLFVNEAVGWACSFIKKQKRYRCFLKNFAKFFITLVNGCLRLFHIKFCREMDFGKKRYKI